MKNIENKNQNLVMSPSNSITEASLLDIFANLSRKIISSVICHFLIDPTKELQRH